MPARSSSSAEVRFLDREKVLAELRAAACQARARHPEIVRVLLFGSLARGDWTGASDADLIVVVARESLELLERSRYQIHIPGIHTDTLVLTATEFETLAADRGSFLAECMAYAIEL